jgi:phosphate transport system protein
MPDHTNRQFDTDIDAMRSAFTTMGGMVERQVIRAMDAVRTGDLRIVTQVLSDERVINQLHVESDLRCNQVIARRQPIAVDLREIIAVLHSVNDLERIGDEAKKIAMKARDFTDRGLPIPYDAVGEMARIAIEMLHDVIGAFMRQDESAAGALLERDLQVDAMRDEIHARLAERMTQDPATVRQSLALIFIVQSIERIGDHAKNLAEYTINVVSGEDPRHGERFHPVQAAAS